MKHGTTLLSAKVTRQRVILLHQSHPWPHLFVIEGKSIQMKRNLSKIRSFPKRYLQGKNEFWLEKIVFTAVMRSQFGLHPHATIYRPIEIVIETPWKFLCMLPDSRSITHASFMAVAPFFWAHWVMEGWKVSFSVLLSDVNLGITHANSTQPIQVWITPNLFSMLSDSVSRPPELMRLISFCLRVWR